MKNTFNNMKNPAKSPFRKGGLRGIFIIRLDRVIQENGVVILKERSD